MNDDIEALLSACTRMLAWIEEGGHDCEFYHNPEAGKCDFCEMVADTRAVIAEQEDKP